MATALVIGLGTSGLHIIEECQQFHYQFTGKNKPDKVRYLYLETDLDQKASATAMGKTDITPVYISLQNIGAEVHTLQADSRLDHSWIPPVDSALAAGNGAGGNSAYGRLALWINYTNVRSAILQNWQQIHGDSYTYVFIVGTLTGGTGSGTCVDMAYLVRNITGSGNVFGLFLTPSRQQLAQSGTDALFYNYFSAITAIRHYSDENQPYDVVWPDGSSYHNNANPFKQCYFVSQDYTNRFAPMQSVSQLYKVAGLHIFSRIHSFGAVDAQNGQSIPNFSATIDRRLLDIQGNVNGYKFSTFGTKLIYYPKELLKEIFGLKLSRQILERWSDAAQFTDQNGNAVSIISQKSQIKGRIRNEFDKSFEMCLNIVDHQNTANGTTLEDEIKTDRVNDLVSKNHQASNTKAYVYQLFSTDNASNYYALVNNNRITIRDQFIDVIYQMLLTKLDEYQNLEVGKLVLEAIADSIDNVLRFWQKTYKIDGQQANWNGILQRKISNMMADKTLPTLLIQRKVYFREQLLDILMLSKMQVAVAELKNISEVIRTAKTTISTQAHRLPAIPQLDGCLSLIKGIIDYTGNDDSVVTLQRRDNEIRANLTTDTPNFSAIFAKGSLDQDLQDLEMSYNNNNQLDKFVTTHITGGQNLWPYLETVTRQQLYEHCMVRSVDYVTTHVTAYFQDRTIVSLLQKMQQTPADPQWQAIDMFITGNEANIRASMPGLEELRPNVDVFSPHNCLKLIYINGDINALRPLMMNYGINPLNDTACELPELNDAIIVFQEYGYMGGNTPTFDPTVNIGVNSTVRQRIKANIDYDNDSAPNPNVFIFKRRVPYMNRGQFEVYLQDK